MTYVAVQEALDRSDAQWPWLPLRRVAELVRLKNREQSAPLLSLSSEAGLHPRPADGGRQLPSEGSIPEYWLVEPGDLVVNPMWLIGGGVAVSEIPGAVSPAYRVYRPREFIHPRFLHYYMRSDSSIRQYELLTRGITTFDRSVSREDLDGMPVPVPPMSVQVAVADHLDAEVARLDQLVALRGRTIALLHERRSAFITATVGRGTTMPVRRVVSMCTSGPRGWGDLVAESGSRFIRSANLSRTSIRIADDPSAFVPAQASPEARRSALQVGDVVVGITGANTGWVGVAEDRHVGAYVSQHVAILRPAGVLPEWLAYSIASDHGQRLLLASQYGGTKTQLGLEDLRELLIRVPPAEHQIVGLTALRRTDEATQAVVAKTEAQIRLLLARRTAAITAAVTGQVEIRGVAA